MFMISLLTSLVFLNFVLIILSFLNFIPPIFFFRIRPPNRSFFGEPLKIAFTHFHLSLNLLMHLLQPTSIPYPMTQPFDMLVLGIPTSFLHQVLSSCNSAIAFAHNNISFDSCTFCPLAKKHQLSVSLSNSHATKPWNYCIWIFGVQHRASLPRVLDIVWSSLMIILDILGLSSSTPKIKLFLLLLP